jgi:hypothetical protein
MQGKVTGAAAVTANGPTIPLKLTGPVATTSSFTPPNNNNTKATVTFKTPGDGNLVVNAVAPDANQNPTANMTTCLFHQTVHATYTVDGGKSTGKFKDATGSGSVIFTFQATGPRLKSGACDQSNNAQPLAAGAFTTFYASGPLTVTS